jgi:hypothetical protein
MARTFSQGKFAGYAYLSFADVVHYGYIHLCYTFANRRRDFVYRDRNDLYFPGHRILESVEIWAAGLPLLVVIGFGIGPAIRVAGRVDDGFRGARLVEGNEVRLVWAPEGQGWPKKSESWEGAKRICRYLTEDGKSLASTPQNIWRLPTVDEAVRSMARHGKNCGGVWDPKNERAIYKITPDKESPLWDTTSQIIYWWTATEKDEDKVYSIVYDGGVWAIDKDWRIGSRAFRAVKEPPKQVN